MVKTQLLKASVPASFAPPGVYFGALQPLTVKIQGHVETEATENRKVSAL